MEKKIIIDAHHHYQNVPGYEDLLAEEYATLGISKVALISGNGEEGLTRLKGGDEEIPRPDPGTGHL